MSLVTDDLDAPYSMQIKNILEEEANRLAIVLDGRESTEFPSRVKIAIRREIYRLRHLARWVESIGDFGSDEPGEELHEYEGTCEDEADA